MLVPGSVSVKMVWVSAKVASAVAPGPVLATVTLQSQLALPPDNGTVPFVVFPVMLLILLAVRSGHKIVIGVVTVGGGLVSTVAVALLALQLASWVKMAFALPSDRMKGCAP